MSLNALALDIALNTGFAINANGKTLYGSIDLKPFKADLGRMGDFFEAHLLSLIDLHGLEYIVLEPPFGRSTSVDHIRGLVFLCEKIAVQKGLQRRFYKAGEWRKVILEHAPRTSGAAKKAVLAWCRDAGFKPANTDESDAIGLLTCALIREGKGTP